MSQNLGLKMAMRPSQMDLMREKERAQRERARMRTEEKNVHIPVFSPPRRTTEKDDRIEQLLGPHSAIIKSLTMDNVGISSQPQTPLPNRSKFFDSHPKKTEVKKNGYRPLQPNATTQKLPSKPLSKPISSAPEMSRNSQNSTESFKPPLMDSNSKSSSHSPDSSKSQSHQPKSSNNIQGKKEICVHSKSKKPTKHSSHKSPHSSSSSSDHESNHIKSTPPSPPKLLPSDKPKPLGNSTKQFPPPNGINRPPRNKLPKLSISSGQNEVHKDVDAILQEMTNLKQPLTAISTPQKADHFPFPNSLMGRNQPLLKNFPEQLSKIPLKSNDIKTEANEEPLDISLVSPIEPLITPPETPIKSALSKPYSEKNDNIHEDLVVSESEDEIKEEINTVTECPSRKDPCKGTRAPVKEPRSSMSSDDSSSSESGNESDSSSDDSDSSSEEEEEEEEDEIKAKVKLEKLRTPPKSPVQEKTSNSLTWSLGNFMSKVNGDKYPKPPSVGSDDRNDNDELLQDIVEKIIKSPGESFTANKTPNSIEKSPYQEPHSHSSSQGDFHSPPSVQSTPSKSLKNGITPSKKSSSDNSDSEIDVVNTPLKKVSLLSPLDQGVAKCLNFDSHSNRQRIENVRNKRQSSDGSILGSLSSDNEEEETIDNNNDSMCNLQEIIHSVGTNRVPLSPIPHEPEKVPKNSPCVKTDVNKDSLKYNDGKPSIVVRLDIKNFAHLFKDRIKKSPYRDKVGIDSKCKEESQKSSYPSVDNRLSLNNLESSFQDKTANTEPVEMDLDTDSEMANGHIEDYTNSVSTLSSTTRNFSDNKCSKYSDKISIKRKQNEADKLFSKRRKSMSKTTNRSTETAQKEKNSHEDDHKWDRKHPHRSGSTDRLRNSSSSSQTDTDKPSEFELVEELNAQTNSDAHPSSVENIFNREGDLEITHEPIIRKQIKRPDEPLESNDVYLLRARELKHQADNLTDRTAKYLLYTESMLSFILCGCAMEKEQRKATDIYRMYSDSFKLISHIYRIRHSAETSDTEKKLAVLIYRIQSILSYKLYKLKKGEALKFKKIIDDHNKSTSSKPPAHAPSPLWNNRSTPSPMSPSGSVGSVGSQGSTGDFTPSKLPNGNISSQSTMSSPGTVAVPQRIHSITQQYLSNINNIVQCHEFWDQAEAVYSDYKEFYEDIDYQCGSLTIYSSVPDLVYYVQTGLQKIKDNT